MTAVTATTGEPDLDTAAEVQAHREAQQRAVVRNRVEHVREVLEEMPTALFVDDGLYVEVSKLAETCEQILHAVATTRRVAQ